MQRRPTYPMFKRVLVPMNGSPSTERILRHLVQVTNWCGSDLTLLHVLHPTGSRPTQDLQIEYPNVLTDRAQALAREYFAVLVEQLNAAGVTARATTAIGEVIDTVVARASAGGFDLMALAVDGRRPAMRHLVECVGEHIRVRSPIPMLILNGHLEGQMGGPKAPLTRLLLAINGTRVSEFALAYVRRVARAGNLPITLLRVVPEIAAYHPAVERAGVATRFVEGARQTAEEYLERHASVLVQQGYDVTTRVEVGPAARTIADVQEAAPEHLLVMSSVIRHGWPRAFLGCTADEVIRISGRPMLLIPAGRRPGPAGDEADAVGSAGDDGEADPAAIDAEEVGPTTL